MLCHVSMDLIGFFPINILSLPWRNDDVKSGTCQDNTRGPVAFDMLFSLTLKQKLAVTSRRSMHKLRNS